MGLIAFTQKNVWQQIAQKREGEKWNHNIVVGSEKFHVTATIVSPRQVAALKHLEPTVETGYLCQSLSFIRGLSGETFGHVF